MASLDNENCSEVRPWSHLPTELLEKIASSVACSDYPYFASVCKSWSRLNRIVFPVSQGPLLLYYQRFQSGLCCYYSPSANKSFIVDCPAVDISGYSFQCVHDGWLLLCSNADCLLIHPFTGIFHKFKGHGRLCSTSYIFYGCPPDDFKIYSFEGYTDNFITISVGDEKDWDYTSYDNNKPFILSPSSNPVLCSDLIYCLGTNGNLGVHDPHEEAWTVFDSPLKFDRSNFCSSLIESRGDLLSVQIGKRGKSVHIFRFDQVSKVWETLQSFGDRALFIGTKTSLVTIPTENEKQNRAYVPRYHEDFGTVIADEECTNGQYYFTSKSLLCDGYDQREVVMKIVEPNILCYSLENGEYPQYFGSSDPLYRIWYRLSLAP